MANGNNATIGFEKQIWDAACVLWGHIPAAEYRKVIVGLIFLRYISNAFEKRYQELVAEGDGFEDDRDAYAEDNIFFVPEDARWSKIASAAHTPEIGTLIDNAMRAIEAENKSLKNVLPKNYASPDLDKRVLGDVVDLFTNMDMSDTKENKDLTEENAALDDTAPESGDDEANPIDRFFEGVDVGSSTAEMNAVADSWAGAWESECRNAAKWLKGQLPLQEDQALVDAYIASAEEQSARMDIMAIYPIADLSVPQDDRANSSGSLRGVLWAGAHQQVWKDTFYQLLYVAPDYASGVDSAVSYQFLFDVEAAQTQLDSLLSAD